MKYRLNEAETSPTRLYNVAKTKIINGKEFVTYNTYHDFVPGEVYESDDKAMIQWFREYRREVRYNSTLESNLKRHNVPYEVKLCPSCGGRVKKISYQVVEVLDE